MKYVILVKKSKASRTHCDPDMNFLDVLCWYNIKNFGTEYGYSERKTEGTIVYNLSRLFKKDLDNNVKKFKSELSAKIFISKDRKSSRKILNRDYEIVTYDDFQRIRQQHLKQDQERRKHYYKDEKKDSFHTRKELTPEQIKENVDKLITKSENNRNNHNIPKSYHISKSKSIFQYKTDS